MLISRRKLRASLVLIAPFFTGNKSKDLIAPILIVSFYDATVILRAKRSRTSAMLYEIELYSDYSSSFVWKLLNRILLILWIYAHVYMLNPRRGSVPRKVVGMAQWRGNYGRTQRFSCMLRATP